VSKIKLAQTVHNPQKCLKGVKEQGRNIRGQEVGKVRCHSSVEEDLKREKKPTRGRGEKRGDQRVIGPI